MSTAISRENSLPLPELAREVIAFIRRSDRGGPTSSAGAPANSARHFNQLATQLFAAQFEANAPFRAFCEARNTNPTSVRDWRAIPAVPTAAFKELNLTCLPAQNWATIFHSSGTTEQRPGRNFHSTDSLAVYEVSLKTWFAQQVLALMRERPDGRDVQTAARFQFLVLTPPASSVPQSSLAYMFNQVVHEFGAPASTFAGELGPKGTWDLNLPTTCLTLDQSIAANQPLILLGTAFNFVHLLDYLAQNNIYYRLPIGSRILETGGYKGRSRELSKVALHSLIHELLGLSPEAIGCEYGMCELASQAYDQPARADRRFHFPPWARIRIISPETEEEMPWGQPGIIQVCDLANVGSVLMIQTGDLGIAFADGSFELLGRAPIHEPRGCSLLAN